MTESAHETKPIVLLEMRPAFDGFAGIPQETRLLFRGLRLLGSLEVTGLLQMSHRILATGTFNRGLRFNSKWLTESRKINRYSRVVISAAERPFATLIDRILDVCERRLLGLTLTIQTLLRSKYLRLSVFRPIYFEDFIWRTLFAKTLPAGDFELVTTAKQFVCTTPWQTMHKAGLNTLSVSRAPSYPKLDTKGIDVFIGQTPYPARVRPETALVIRYHDAFPVLMPHTISDKSFHQASHFYALTSNVKSGAWFACVSDATRADLLKLFPEVEDRAVTIHNMVSHHYCLDTSPVQRVPGIIRSRLYSADSDVMVQQDAQDVDLVPKFLTLRERENFYRQHLRGDPLRYLLAVSTVEPRKNHTRLLAAWEVLKAEVDPDLKLVLVGSLGWGYKQLMRGLRIWIDRGDLFMLNGVPAPDLRVLYRHASATVCPSVAEGFDFSGVESMRSGGVVVASDIPVHREVFANAAEYFNPYSTASLVESLKRTVYAPDAPQVQERLRVVGQEVSAQYLPERILPRWDSFLAQVLQSRRSRVRSMPAHASPGIDIGAAVPPHVVGASEEA